MHCPKPVSGDHFLWQIRRSSLDMKKHFLNRNDNFSKGFKNFELAENKMFGAPNGNSKCICERFGKLRKLWASVLDHAGKPWTSHQHIFSGEQHWCSQFSQNCLAPSSNASSRCLSFLAMEGHHDLDFCNICQNASGARAFLWINLCGCGFCNACLTECRKSADAEICPSCHMLHQSKNPKPHKTRPSNPEGAVINLSGQHITNLTEEED